jgi:hypothetical protein
MADENVTQTPAPDFAGYSNSEELARGYRASSQEAKRLAAENQRLQEQFQSVAANQRQDIPQRQNARESLREFGIPVDPLVELLREEIRSEFAPLAQAANARPRVMAEYPDYATYETAVNDWVRSDVNRSRDYDERFVKDAVGAMKLAFLEFGEVKRKSAPPPQAPNAQEMADASLPGGRAGDSRRTENSAQGAIEDAFKRYQASGSQQDAEAFAKLRIRQSIPDSFFADTG